MDSFKKELLAFPNSTKEDLFSLIVEFLSGRRLPPTDLKIIRLNKNTRIVEFKVKDNHGNWRAISTVFQGKYLVFVYAFHKKSQKLLQKDKELIISRIARINL
ncbi:type II toxin-antitoxin system RelE/ParE family toxin [Bdellovibrio sp. KM01]|nr:type II toxin-antitoxin system RelE/ParE family toxin [Bdellovibrio sp. KM01]